MTIIPIPKTMEVSEGSKANIRLFNDVEFIRSLQEKK